MNKSTVYILLTAVLISGCAKELTSSHPFADFRQERNLGQFEQWEILYGKWYGNQRQKNGGTNEWLVERFEDATYKILFKDTKPDGTVDLQTEIGQWAISGPIYFTSFRGWVYGEEINVADPSNPNNYDAYQIIKLDSKTFEYEHLTTGNRYTVVKVGPEFELE